MKSVKIMLLGISIMLFAAIWVLDPAASLGGTEFILLFIGLLTSVIGFFSGGKEN